MQKSTLLPRRLDLKSKVVEVIEVKSGEEDTNLGIEWT